MFSLPQSLSYPNCRCLQKTNLGLYIERLGVLFLFNVCRSKQTNNLASQQSDRVGGEANGKERGRGWRSRSITCPVFRNNNMQSSSSSQQSNVLKRNCWSNCTKENRQLFDWRFVGGHISGSGSGHVQNAIKDSKLIRSPMIIVVLLGWSSVRLVFFIFGCFIFLYSWLAIRLVLVQWIKLASPSFCPLYCLHAGINEKCLNVYWKKVKDVHQRGLVKKSSK